MVVRRKSDKIDIDLDDEVIDQLIADCKRHGKSDDYRGCSDCKIKFMCWTHKKKEDEKES